MVFFDHSFFDYIRCFVMPAFFIYPPGICYLLPVGIPVFVSVMLTEHSYNDEQNNKQKDLF